MSVVLWPSGIIVTEMEVQLERVTQVSRSPFTFARQVQRFPGAALWRIEFATAPLQLAQARQFQAWLAAMGGAANQCRVPVYEEPNFATTMTVVVNGAGQTGNALNISGAPNNFAGLKSGMHVTVNDQLLRLVSDASIGSNGAGSVVFEPMLRASPANGAAVEVHRPWVLAALRDDVQDKYKVSRGGIYEFKVSMDEAFTQ